jgi:hypothetical protein
MAISDITQQLKKINDQLLRPNLSLYDKGRLVLTRGKLSKQLSKLEKAAQDSVATQYQSEINHAQRAYNDSKKVMSEFSTELAKELKAATKGIEALQRVSLLLKEQGSAVASIKHSESNRKIPKTNDITSYLTNVNIEQALIADCFKALNVNYGQIDKHAKFYASTGCKKDNVQELINRIDNIHITDVNIEDWYLDNHKAKTNISQEVQDIIDGATA